MNITASAVADVSNKPIAEEESKASGDKEQPITDKESQVVEGTKSKRRTWKKPKDKPKRPLSSYNIFFRKFVILSYLICVCCD